jgi:hypothetical protein
MRRTLPLLLATLVLSACADAVAPLPDAAFARGERTGPTTTIQSLAAGINGPGTVGSYTTCTFTSTVSGGTAPYTYAWSIAGASGGYLSLASTTGASVQATGYNYGSYGSTGSVYLLLTVTDANGATAYAPAKRVLIPYSSTSC